MKNKSNTSSDMEYVRSFIKKKKPSGNKLPVKSSSVTRKSGNKLPVKSSSTAKKVVSRGR